MLQMLNCKVVVRLLLVTLLLMGSCIVMYSTATQEELPHSLYYEPTKNTFLKRYMDLPKTARSMSPTFLTDPPTEAFRSHSQKSRQDLLVLAIFRDKRDGTFVDLAANDWQEGSNTYNLEYFNGWKGICIEPNPVYLEGLLSNRKCTVVTSPVSKSSGEVVKFRFHPVGGVGGIVGEGLDNSGGDEPSMDHLLTTTTLTQLLDFTKAPAVMDYLSLDVEGAEHFVLQGLDASKYTFKIITIERPKQHSHHLLAKAGYRFIFQMAEFGECLYAHQSMPEYANVLQNYAQNSVPNWYNAAKPYLLQPRWNETYAGPVWTWR